jgi:cardiolipin synthase
MIIIIVGRDILITVMRILAIKKEKQLHTSHFGKFKTAFQMLSIVIIIMIYMSQKSGFFVTHESVPYYIMLAVTVMTAFSGTRYIITNWRLFFPEKKPYLADE